MKEAMIHDEAVRWLGMLHLLHAMNTKCFTVANKMSVALYLRE